MKKHVLLMSIMAFIFLGCSNSGNEKNPEINQEISITEAAMKMIQSDQFQNQVNLMKGSSKSKLSNTKSSSNNGNGVFIVESFGFYFFPFFYDGGFIVFGVFGPGFETKVLPNGMAEWSVESNGPWCLWVDDNEGEFNNNCFEPNMGKFSFKYQGTLDITEEPWGTVYNVVSPYKTPIVAKALNFVLNDADTFDDNGTPDNPDDDFNYCREESVTQKTVNLTFIGKRNNNNEDSENLLTIKAH